MKYIIWSDGRLSQLGITDAKAETESIYKWSEGFDSISKPKSSNQAKEKQ